MDMDNVVIQLHAGESHDFVRYLIAMDFRRVVLDTPPWRFKTVGQLLRQYTSGLLQLLVHLRSVRGLGTVIVFSHFAFVVKLLARLGLMRYRTCSASVSLCTIPSGFRFFAGWCVSIVQTITTSFSANRRWSFIRAELGIAARRMHFVPLGDWRQMRSPVQFQPASEGDYYFAGGRSNRDYRPVIEAFRSLPVSS